MNEYSHPHSLWTHLAQETAFYFCPTRSNRLVWLMYTLKLRSLRISKMIFWIFEQRRQPLVNPTDAGFSIISSNRCHTGQPHEINDACFSIIRLGCWCRWSEGRSIPFSSILPLSRHKTSLPSLWFRDSMKKHIALHGIQEPWNSLPFGIDLACINPLTKMLPDEVRHAAPWQKHLLYDGIGAWMIGQGLAVRCWTRWNFEAISDRLNIQTPCDRRI